MRPVELHLSPSPRVGRRATSSPLVPMSTLNTTVPRFIGSHTAKMVASYTGRLGVAQFNGATFDIPYNAFNKMDTAAVLAWWAGRPGGGSYANGPYPRLKYIENQLAQEAGGLLFTGQFEQLTEASMPVLDPNNIHGDGFWPASFNGRNARTTDTTGAALATLEENCFMTYNAAGGTPATSNTGNNSVAIVLGAVDNLGNSTAGTPQNSIFGMSQTTQSNRWTLRSGDTDYSTRFGFGFFFGAATKSWPAVASAVKARLNRQVVLCSHTTNTSTVWDGVTPGNACSNVRVNGLTTESYLATGTGRTSNTASGAGFMKIGQTADGTAASGMPFEFYAITLYSNSLCTAGVAGAPDQRSIVEGDLISMFRVRTAYTRQCAVYGSSSIAGYYASTGLGIAHDLQKRVNDLALSVETYAFAGSSMIADVEPNKATLSSVKTAGMTHNIYVNLNARNDLTSGAATGSATYTAHTSMVGKFHTDGWDKKFICTLFTSVTAAPTSQGTFDTERADFNTRVMNAANQAANNYTAVDPASLAHLSNYNDPIYFDGTVHTRGGPGGGSTEIAALLETAIRAVY